jgi:transcriptional regulator with XRE-family HTH domain
MAASGLNRRINLSEAIWWRMSRQREKTPVQKALIQLRKMRGMTQQQFSEAVGVTMISVNRWETSRPPTGPSLWRLVKYALDSGAFEIAAVFQRAADKSLPIPPPNRADEQALKELRHAAQYDPALRERYLAVLRKLATAHAELMNMSWSEEIQLQLGLEWEDWEETQKDLEWMLKHVKKEGAE